MLTCMVLTWYRGKQNTLILHGNDADLVEISAFFFAVKTINTYEALH
jgi:hypothetical protein